MFKYKHQKKMKNKYILTLLSITLIALLNFSYAEEKTEEIKEGTKSWNEIKQVLEKNLKNTYGEMFNISNFEIKNINHKKEAGKQIYKVSAKYEKSYIFKKATEFPYIKGANLELKKLGENSELYKSLKKALDGRIKEAEISLTKKLKRNENFVIEKKDTKFLVYVERAAVRGDKETELIRLEENKIVAKEIEKAGREFVIDAILLENSDNSYKNNLHGILSKEEFEANSKAIKKELEANDYLAITSFVIRKLERVKDKDTNKDAVLARISYKYKYKFMTKEDLPYFKGMYSVLSNLKKDSKNAKALQTYISETIKTYDLEKFQKEDSANLDVLIVKENNKSKYFEYFDPCKDCKKEKKELSKFYTSTEKMFNEGKLTAENYLNKIKKEQSSLDILSKFFKDITKKSKYYIDIEKAKKFKIINGYLDKTFRENDDLTKAEFIQILSNTVKDGVYLAVDGGVQIDKSYQDKWYYDASQRLITILPRIYKVNRNLAKIKFDEKINRLDAMMVVYKLLRKKEDFELENNKENKKVIVKKDYLSNLKSEKNKLKKDEITAINYLFELGIYKDIEKEILSQKHITRGEFLSIANRIFEFKF